MSASHSHTIVAPLSRSSRRPVNFADGFFQHHGPWAPGVRMFRKLQFRTKALIISAVFVAPIALLAWDFLAASMASIAFSEQERLGVSYQREAVPLVRLAQLYRRAHANGGSASEVEDARKALDAQMVKLETAAKQLNADFGESKALADVKSAATVASNAGASTAFQAHTAHIDAIIALINQVTDGSNLTLDPDLDTYFLMDGALNTVPTIIVSVGNLRGLSLIAARSDEPFSGELQRVITSNAVATELFDSRLNVALGKVFGVHPEYKSGLKVDDLHRQLQDFRELVMSGKGAPATLVSQGTAVVDGYSALQLQLLDHLDELLAARVDGMVFKRNVTMVVVVVALLLAAYLFYSFFLVTEGGLKEIERHLVAMTDGDLTTTPSPWGKDEAAKLMLSIGEMQASLRSIVTKVRGSSESIVNASTEIASASMDLSGRTEQTAANLEQSAAAMEQISSTVKHTADNVREAAHVASGNSQAAARGGQVISEVVSTMQEINASSQKISDIIGTINGIAFQTNILALNAAVEAARAGEQGRGFAVVASEVRSLAQRSAEAAREIKILITDSVEKVRTGTQVVQGAGDTMQELVGNAQRMNELLSEISTAASEQSNGLGQVGLAVNELDRSTQQNAALVEQTAAAASGLEDQARGLAGEVSRFSLPAAA